MCGKKQGPSLHDVTQTYAHITSQVIKTCSLWYSTHHTAFFITIFQCFYQMIQYSWMNLAAFSQNVKGINCLSIIPQHRSDIHDRPRQHFMLEFTWWAPCHQHLETSAKFIPCGWPPYLSSASAFYHMAKNMAVNALYDESDSQAPEKTYPLHRSL